MPSVESKLSRLGRLALLSALAVNGNEKSPHLDVDLNHQGRRGERIGSCWQKPKFDYLSTKMVEK